MQRYRRRLELASQRAAVQRLDVGELVLVAPGAGVDLAGRERPEHEGVVRIGAVREANGAASGHASVPRRPASLACGRRRGCPHARRIRAAGGRARPPPSRGTPRPPRPPPPPPAAARPPRAPPRKRREEAGRRRGATAPPPGPRAGAP